MNVQAKEGMAHGALSCLLPRIHQQWPPGTLGGAVQWHHGHGSSQAGLVQCVCNECSISRGGSTQGDSYGSNEGVLGADRLREDIAFVT